MVDANCQSPTLPIPTGTRPALTAIINLQCSRLNCSSAQEARSISPIFPGNACVFHDIIPEYRHMKIRLSLISLALVAGAFLPITPAYCAVAQQNTPAAAPAVTATPAAAPSSQAAPAGCGSGCGAGCGTTQAAPAGCGSGCGAGCGSAAASSPADALAKQLQLTPA